MALVMRGRPYSGLKTVYSVPRLELSLLRKAGYFTEGRKTIGQWSWSNGDSVGLTAFRRGAEVYMELDYTWTDPRTDKAEVVHQRIDVVRKPGNLGKGHVLYFRCPHTGRLCRILYRAYHARTFRSRWGFSYRLYYPGQLCGKLDRSNTRYWDLERHLDGMHKRRKPGTYLGKPTKRAERKERLFAELVLMDELRWSPQAWPAHLRPHLGAILDTGNS